MRSPKLVGGNIGKKILRQNVIHYGRQTYILKDKKMVYKIIWTEGKIIKMRRKRMLKRTVNWCGGIDSEITQT